MISFKKRLYSTKWCLHHPTSFVRFRDILENERASLDAMEAMHRESLRLIVTKAYTETKFYKRHYGAAGFELGDMQQDNWFERLPVVTKDDIRGNFDDFVSLGNRKWMKISTTGGSTGVPLMTGYDKRLPEEIYSWRLQNWFGVCPWDDHAYVWRNVRRSFVAKCVNDFAWWPTRHLKLDASVIDESQIRRFIQKFNKLKPTLLWGYVGAVSQVARYVIDNGIEVHSPKFVWTTSAPLTSSCRRVIENAFKSPVCDQYGSCEIRWIAAQCPECKGLHVNMEHVHVEFVDNKNHSVDTGSYGRVLLTNLEDEVFPLIRYENGDRGRWLGKSCSCGRTLPCMDSVKGRESESFILPSGKTINGEFLTTIFDKTPDLVSGFRVVQHKNLSITIEYVPSGDETKIITILDDFALKINNEVPISYKRCNSIGHDRGKSRYVIRER